MRHTNYHIVFSFSSNPIRFYKITHKERMSLKQYICTTVSKVYKSRIPNPNKCDVVKQTTGNMYSQFLKYF